MSDIETTLRENGYATDEVNIEGASRVQLIDREQTPWFEGGMLQRTFTVGETMIAIVELSADEATPTFTKLRDGLVKVLAPADKLLRKHVRPLVRVTPTSAQFIYANEDLDVCLGRYPRDPEFGNGLHCSDAPTPYVVTRLRCVASVLIEGGDWLNGQSPLTVPRASLPVWNSEAITAKLRTLVDRFITDGSVKECGPYVPPTQDYSTEAQLLRQGVRVVPPTPEPARVPYKDSRLEAAFNPDRFTTAGDPELFADAPREGGGFNGFNMREGSRG